MILFFEGKDYKRSLLDSVFGNEHARVISHGNLKDNKAVLDCVGYYYDPTQSHVFILPKVFNIDGKGFGCIDLTDESPVRVSDSDIKTLKDNEWRPELLTELPIYLYQAIEKYRKREIDNISAEKDSVQSVMSSKKGKNESSLMDVILSLRDFYNENQSLFVLIYKQAHSGYNKVSWNKTIRTRQPVIKDKKVIYPFIVNRRKEINYDEDLLVLFFNTLRYINNEYYFNFSIDQPYSLLSDSEYKRRLERGAVSRKLKSIRNNYFNEKLVLLWELLFAFASKVENVRDAKEKEEYLLIRDFNNVFEDMIDVLLGDSDAPRSLVKQQDGKIVDHLFKGLSLTTATRQVYYVGDSKYYKENAAPKGDSLFKQYTYAKNIIQTQLDWFHKSEQEKEKKEKEYLKYRDELTEGYNITPNFFISGRIEKNYRFTSAELHLQDINFDKNYQFKNRIFDRDTLFLRMYDINFLFALYAYVNRSQSIRNKFKDEAKEVFRKDFIEYIDTEYNFYLLQQRGEEDIQNIVNTHFWELNGKVFCPYDKGEKHYGLLMLGLEKDDYVENAKLLSGLSNDFIIKEYHLGTEPYVYFNGLYFGKEVSKTIVFRDALTDGAGNYRSETVLIGCYRSQEQRDWILKNKLYNVRFNEGRTGTVYEKTQQVFTASFLMLYDYNNLHGEVECYSLSGVTFIADSERMKEFAYPKQDWMGDEKYLVYKVGDRVEGEIDLIGILERHPEVQDGRPLFVYFKECQ
jgi:hypothetical protein